jgi:hypothetical protein
MSSYKKLQAKYESSLAEIKNLSKHNPSDVEKIIQPSSSRISRFTTDVSKWRAALNSAESVENPSYADLQRVYNEVDLDSEVTSSKTIRKNYVLSRDWRVLKNDEENEQATEFFKDRWLFDFIDGVLESSYWGYNLIRLGDIKEDKLTGVEVIQRQNVNPKLNRLLETPYNNTSGIDLSSPKHKNWYVLCSDTEDNHYTGLFNKLSAYQIQLKNTQIAYTDYTSRFGSPNIVINTQMSDEGHVRNVESYLENFQNSSYAIVGDNDTVNLVESSGKSGDVFTNLIKEMKSNITKTIIGNDTANSEKSFVGSSEIAQNQANIYSLKDIKYVEFYINKDLIPKLINLGLSFLEGVVFRFDTTNKAKPEEEFKNIIEFVKTGRYHIPAEYISEKMGIPIEDISNVLDIQPTEDEENKDKK